MLDNLFSPQLDNLQRALSRTSQRQALLTGNIANMDTPGYKRQDIDFGIVLKGQMSKGQMIAQQFRDRQQQMASARTSITSDGNNVDIEREVMSVAETELRYQTLADMTTHYLDDLKTVIKG